MNDVVSDETQPAPTRSFLRDAGPLAAVRGLLAGLVCALATIAITGWPLPVELPAGGFLGGLCIVIAPTLVERWACRRSLSWILSFLAAAPAAVFSILLANAQAYYTLTAARSGSPQDALVTAFSVLEDLLGTAQGQAYVFLASLPIVFATVARVYAAQHPPVPASGRSWPEKVVPTLLATIFTAGLYPLYVVSDRAIDWLRQRQATGA